jgi:hypothetical protein
MSARERVAAEDTAGSGEMRPGAILWFVVQKNETRFTQESKDSRHAARDPFIVGMAS